MNILILCVFFFFLCLCTRESVEKMQTFGVVSDSKMNVVGALGGHFLNFPIVYKSAGKNGNFYAKPFFDQIDFFIWFDNIKYILILFLSPNSERIDECIDFTMIE
ncbi:Uncharacterized protein FWK35_00020215, partial [Aphis craccivora]